MRRTMMLLAALTLGSACSPRYDGVSFERVAGADEGELSQERLSVPVGRVVVFRVDLESMEGRQDYDATDELELTSTQESIARIEPSVRVDTWMLMGTAIGQAELEVRVNGELKDVIPVEVEPAG